MAEVTYNTANGPKTPTQMAQELTSVGWQGSGEIKDVYARTTGGAVTPSSSSSSSPTSVTSSPGTPGPAAGPPVTNVQADANLMNAANQAANQAYLNAKLNLDTDDLAFRKATQAFTNALNASAVTGTYEGAPTQAAQSQAFNQAITEAGVTGYYNAPGSAAGVSPADAQAQLKSISDKAVGLKTAADAATARLAANPNDLATRQAATYAVDAYTAAQNDWVARSPGLQAAAAGTASGQGTPTLARESQQQKTTNDYLTLISGLKGPQDYGSYLRTLGSTPGGMRDLVASAAGQYTPATGATSGVSPAGASLGGLVGDAASGTASGTSYADYMNTAGGVPAPNQIAPAAWNAYTDSQKKLLLGMYGQSGWDTQDVQDLYKQSLPKYSYSPGTTGTVKV